MQRPITRSPWHGESTALGIVTRQTADRERDDVPLLAMHVVAGGARHLRRTEARAALEQRAGVQLTRARQACRVHDRTAPQTGQQRTFARHVVSPRAVTHLAGYPEECGTGLIPIEDVGVGHRLEPG